MVFAVSVGRGLAFGKCSSHLRRSGGSRVKVSSGNVSIIFLSKFSNC